jgi:branched-subunit amino acid transport protein
MVIIYALIIYVCRLSGFLLDFKQMPGFLQDYLSFVPITVFSVFIASSLQQTEFTGGKFIALLLAAILMWRFRQQTVAILAGMAVFLLSGLSSN